MGELLHCALCRSRVALAALALIPVVFLISVARGGTFTVINTADSGLGSLRWAITNANANAGADTINFLIIGTPPFTINLLSALPTVTDPVTIDGTSQPEWATLGAPVVELNGQSAGSSAAGLQLNSAFNTVKGLAINRFAAEGIVLNGASNVVQGSYIGTDTTGLVPRGNADVGIWVKSSGNIIGGTKVASRNLISGGNLSGIYVQIAGGNTIQGNWIGLDSTGTNALRNNNYGIQLQGSTGNLIGGVTAAARNIVSGNGSSGFFLNGGGGQNIIQGNFIGTDTSGELVVSNVNDGITVTGVSSNSISGNLISGNGTNGVFLSGAGSSGNIVAGNLIGTDFAGKLALGNHNAGVTLTVGGNLIGPSNVVSGNLVDGIFLASGANGNLVQGNLIGLSAAGTNALPNIVNGIQIFGASSNIIGGTNAAARNVISGNSGNGVLIFLVTDVSNNISGNYIGTDVTGKKAVANALTGVRVQGCSNIVGGVTAGSGNVISGNRQIGVFLAGTNGSVIGNVIQGNLIGLTSTGDGSLGNVWAGIGLSGAAKNQIGGTTAAARNVISANGNTSSTGLGGVFFSYAGTTGNIFQGNYIGTDASGTAALGNVNDGIYLLQADTNYLGGSDAGAGNLISANGVDGLYLSAASWNVVQGNCLGTKADGTNALGNLFHNIEIDVNATNETVGGSTAGSGNRIAFARFTQASGHAGVRIRNGSLNNLISRNCIFSNTDLGIDLGNFGINANMPGGTNIAANAANAGQNYPVLTNVYVGSGTQIRGIFDCRTNKTYVLQFFASSTGNTNGYGEGQVFLGQINLALGAATPTNFTASLPVTVPAGWVVTATAADPVNNTSEFSAWTNAVTFIVPRVQASAVNPTNQLISISWTNNGGNYVLQQTFSLSPPQQWITVTNTPLPANGVLLVSLPATNSTAFFRLQVQ